MSEQYHSGMFYHRMLKMFREANKTKERYKMCEKCKGNHYYRTEDGDTKFCDRCNGRADHSFGVSLKPSSRRPVSTERLSVKICIDSR